MRSGRAGGGGDGVAQHLREGVEIRAGRRHPVLRAHIVRGMGMGGFDGAAADVKAQDHPVTCWPPIQVAAAVIAGVSATKSARAPG